MNASERASARIDAMLHDAHLRYQREQLKADHTRGALPCSEVRGVRVRNMPVQMLQSHWFTGLRPNFWRGYIETMLYMQ